MPEICTGDLHDQSDKYSTILMPPHLSETRHEIAFATVSWGCLA